MNSEEQTMWLFKLCYVVPDELYLMKLGERRLLLNDCVRVCA